MKKAIQFAEFQRIAKELLKTLTDYLDAHDLRYNLAGGTLLGAARHHDIIPWDYDIDIQMPRPDFNRLIELVRTEPVAPHVRIDSWDNTRNYFLPFMKVCDNRTQTILTQTKHSHSKGGVWVDIFPLDGANDDMQQNRAIQKQVVSLQRQAIRPFVAMPTWKESLAQLPARFRNIIRPAASYIRQAQQIAQANDYETAQNVGTITSLDAAVEREINPKSYYAPAKLLFGDYEFTVPAEYDKILRNRYGDYMQLPPEEDRQIPQIECYWVE